MTSYIGPQEKLFKHLDRLAILQDGRTPPPINIEIDLSNRCSLGCSWCHFAFTHTRGPLAGKQAKPEGAIPGGDLMDTALALRIVKEFKDAGVRSVVWTGGGEPTLHPAFDAIIAHTLGCQLQQGIYTHGGHIAGKAWGDLDRAKLLKSAMSWVYVSLDAADAADYKRDKGVDRFDKACDGVRALVAAEGSATIGVGFLLTSENWRRWPEMVELSQSLGADYCQFRPTIHYRTDEPGVPDEDREWMAEAIQHLESAAELPGVEVDLTRFQMYHDWHGHGYHTCWWSALQSVVTPDGSMWTCVNKREHPGERIGSLADESFAAIWGRHKACAVNAACRVMCRGHLANQQLDRILTPTPHSAFV